MSNFLFRGHKGVTRYSSGQEPNAWFSYKCGYCGNQVSGAVIGTIRGEGGPLVQWLYCPHCGHGAVWNASDKVVHPPAKFGPDVQELPDIVKDAYDEARKCFAVGAYRACMLTCRALLMYVAVEQGDQEGKPFTEYIEYLAEKGFVTDAMKPWVNEIRNLGNNATHQITAGNQKQAENVLMFTVELLRLVYELPALTKKFTAK